MRLPRTLDELRARAMSFHGSTAQKDQALLLLRKVAAADERKSVPEDERWAARQLEDSLIEGVGAWLLRKDRKDRPHSQGGMRTRTPEGVVQVRIDFEDMDWAQLEDAKRWRTATIRGHAAELERINRALELREKAPTATGPKQAAEHLKLDLGEYLAGAA